MSIEHPSSGNESDDVFDKLMKDIDNLGLPEDPIEAIDYLFVQNDDPIKCLSEAQSYIRDFIERDEFYTRMMDIIKYLNEKMHDYIEAKPTVTLTASNGLFIPDYNSATRKRDTMDHRVYDQQIGVSGQLAGFTAKDSRDEAGNSHLSLTIALREPYLLQDSGEPDRSIDLPDYFYAALDDIKHYEIQNTQDQAE